MSMKLPSPEYMVMFSMDPGSKVWKKLLLQLSGKQNYASISQELIFM
jgi:hypothetical protein